VARLGVERVADGAHGFVLFDALFYPLPRWSGNASFATPRPWKKRRSSTFLAAAPRTARALWRAANQLGLARRTVLRAKKLLKIRHKNADTAEGRRTFWLLGGQTVADYRLPSPATLEPWLNPLREKYGKGASKPALRSRIRQNSG
jgi:hypothetical protein